MKISVILPFYNSGKFLDNLFRNLVECQFNVFERDEWQLIAVNDGSTDNSADIVRKWADDYCRNILYIEQTNSGVSKARNIALSKAEGEYIYFVDADDLLIPGALRKIVDIAEQEKADVVRFLAKKITPEEYHSQSLNPQWRVPEKPEKAVVTAAEFLERTRAMLDYPSLWSVWSSLFRRNFIEERCLKFVEGLHFGEDKIFMYEALFSNPRLVVLDSPLYLYQVHPDSATESVASEHLKSKYDSIKLLNKIEKELYLRNRDKLSPRVRKYFKLGMGHEIVSLLKYAISHGKSMCEIQGLLRLYCSYTGRFRCSKKIFQDERLESSSRSRMIAWYASRIVLPYHFILHRREYTNL